MSPERIKKNEAVLSRLAARREVRRLRQNKKRVPAELLAQAGVGMAIKMPDNCKPAEITKRGAETLTRLDVSKGAVGRSRQSAAKELGIKNRRWMTVAELDEAINCKTSVIGGAAAVSAEGKARFPDAADTGYAADRLAELEQLGRDRCKAAWDAWKAKQEGQADG